MKLKIFLAIAILTAVTSICFAQAPPQPAVLPKGDAYTSQNIDNNTFAYPDAVKVVSSGTVNISGSTVTVITITLPIRVIESTGVIRYVQTIIDPIDITGSTVNAVLSITNPISVAESSGIIKYVTQIILPVDVTGSTVNILGMLTANINDSNVFITSGTIFTTPEVYENKTSSGADGLITAQTTQTLTVSENVTSFSFKYKNLVNTEQYAQIQASHRNGNIFLSDGDAVSLGVEIPQAVTFTLTSLSVSATMQYNINTLK